MSLRSLAALAAVIFIPALAPAQGQYADIKGRVVFSGTQMPALPPINTGGAAGCPAQVGDEKWVVNPANKGVRYAVIWLLPAQADGVLDVQPAKKVLAKKDVEVDQPQCVFEPHVVALQEGQTLLVKNSAAIAHSAKWETVATSGSVIIPPNGEYAITGWASTKTPRQLTCGIHPWMSGWVACFKHPYFAVTDADGNFAIKGAPAGKCRYVVWHEVAGYRGGVPGGKGTPVNVPADGIDLGDLGIQPRE